MSHTQITQLLIAGLCLIHGTNQVVGSLDALVIESPREVGSHMTVAQVGAATPTAVPVVAGCYNCHISGHHVTDVHERTITPVIVHVATVCTQVVDECRHFPHKCLGGLA